MTSEKKNTGLVPLVNFGLDYSFNDKFGAVFDIDAIAGGPGRAEDAMLAARFKAGKSTSLRAGYRIVEGGADVGEVYNFALLNYWIIGFEHTF